ncbi:thermonuclease family protein [Aliarcobacter butzleri]|uniref:thermonuclease family protein n=1 Tax=Aliarcobacter butzleri TaxID=28197 RepID=UPI002B24F4A0|nr:thermonuclease family protein [Aliarcobacter butzleri]
MIKHIMILLLLISNNLLSLELKGKIIHISDGDTVHLLTDNKEKIKIRLNDIDAPESKQAFGNKSKENLKNYIYCKNRSELDTNVGVRPDAKTEFNRTVKRS